MTVLIIAILHFATAVSRLERIRRGRMADIRILLVDDEPDISATAFTQAAETGFYDV